MAAAVVAAAVVVVVTAVAGVERGIAAAVAIVAIYILVSSQILKSFYSTNTY